MKYERAQYIFQSEDRYTVLHDNEPVWIESLDKKKETAVVSKERTSYAVPVEVLKEA